MAVPHYSLERKRGFFRLAVIEPLYIITTELAQNLDLRLIFNAFRYDSKAERARHGDDGLDHGERVRAGAEFRGEGAIDLQGGHGHVLQIAQRRVAGAKVVYRNPYA